MEKQNVQNPTPEPTSTSVQASEPKTKFPGIYLVLSLLILVLLASTVFLYYQNIQLKNMLASYQTQPAVSPTPATYQSPIPSTTTNPTANWKTYISTKMNFEMKYPATWLVDATDGVLTSSEKFRSGPEPISYWIYVNEEKTLPTFPAGGTYSNDTVANLSVKYTDKLPSRSGCLDYFIPEKTTGFVRIGLCPYDTTTPFPKQDEYVSSFKQILSTFKFTN